MWENAELIYRLKSQAAVDAVAAGKKVIWTDDDAIPDNRAFRERFNDHLLIEPARSRGLTPDHLAMIHEFILAERST